LSSRTMVPVLQQGHCSICRPSFSRVISGDGLF
jgi:hypothetical protein